MEKLGVLETLARADLDRLIEQVAMDYRPGAMEELAAQDPAWCQAVEAVEREVGALYDALREADATFVRWRRAVSELQHLWARAREAPAPAPMPETAPLGRVA